jgi:hypothetical protein
VSGYFSCQPLIVCFQAERSGWALRAAERAGADRLDQLLDDQAAVADDRHVGPADLAELGRVDVDVDDLGVGAKPSTLPVTRSSKRLPRAISRSDSASR